MSSSRLCVPFLCRDILALRTPSAGSIRTFLYLRNVVAGQAAANGLTEERLADLLSDEA